MAIQLHDFQKSVKKQVYDYFRSGLKSVLVFSPTGSGKTVIASNLIFDAVKKNRRVLFLVHRGRLVQQTINVLARNGVEASVIWADWHEPPDYSKLVQIAMIQTLQRRELPEDIGLVIVDEAHTTSYYNVYRDSIVPKYSGDILPLSPCFFIGLTGSPWRNKASEGFCQFFQAVVRAPYPQQLVEMGYLCHSRQFGYEGLIDFKKLDSQDGDYTRESLQRVCNTIYNKEIVRRYIEFCPERKAIAFCAGVKQCEELTKLFIDAGFTAEAIVESTKPDERNDIYERFATGITHILVSVDVLCAGYDEPSVEAVIIARPTKSLSLFIQICGRGMRIFPDKHDCYFLDFGENFKRLGLHTKERETPLCPRGKEKTEIPTKTCPKCHEIIPTVLRICPHCGYIFSQNKSKEIPIAKPFGEILSPEQKKQAKFLRRYLYDCFWKSQEYESIVKLDTIFEKKYQSKIPNEWCRDAIFQGNFKLDKYNQQLYIRFLRSVTTHAYATTDWEWINLMVIREFGDRADLVYLPWWRIFQLSKPIDDQEQIRQIYEYACRYYANNSNGEEMLRLLSLAMCEATGVNFAPGSIVNWLNCPTYLEWMQPFKITDLDVSQNVVSLEGIRNPVAIAELVAIS